MMEHERIDLSGYDLSSITNNLDNESLHNMIEKNNKNGISLKDVRRACFIKEDDFYERQNEIGD